MSGRPVAIVTGARRGIGFAIAQALARGGFDIALTDREEEAGESVEALKALGARAHFFRSDLAALETHAATVRRIANRFGRIDCLVNNAGVGPPVRGDFLALTPENFDRVMGVNLRGTVFWTQAVMEAMVEAETPAPGRAIVNITSVSAGMSSPDRLDYCMSKAALSSFGQGLALRLAPDGIAVFEVRPGIIRTAMTAGVADKYDRLIADGLVPAGRWGEAGDVANVVAALASGRFSFATGSVIHADGALSVSRL